MALKPYQYMPIQESGETLSLIPLDTLAIVDPHPYAVLGAPYGNKSPYYLRETVTQRLLTAQQALTRDKPGWKLQIFDAYRPICVQAFMVQYSFEATLQTRNLSPKDLTPKQNQEIWDHVHTFWAAPSQDPQTPPPHSTGGAIDLTLVDQEGVPIEMGCPIDELSPRAYPNHFAQVQDPMASQWHQARTLLRSVMESAGFRQHPNEWWHFSFGDQLWAWLQREFPLSSAAKPHPEGCVACYGRAE